MDPDPPGLATSLERVLAAAPSPPAVLAAVTAECPSIDAAAVLVRHDDDWALAARVGAADLAGREEGTAGTTFDRLVERGAPARVAGADVPGVLPAGTRAALVLPFAPMGGAPDCVVLFGSRTQSSIGDRDALLAHVAGERVARVVDAERLAARSADAEHVRRRTGGFRDQVLAIVGHDLRNPLGAIVMSASLLQSRGDLAGWQARAVERVRASAGRMGRIIDDLLSYTRTRLGGGIPVVRAPADLGEVVRKIADEVRFVHPQATVEVERAGDLTGSWDATRLEQVISNLLSNAIDHGEDGAPVHVGVCGGAGAVELAVTNEGEIPDAVLEHAFEAFHRSPAQEARRASGLGLGLYIAREIVERHGGDISVRSDGGRTTVLVSLPRDERPEHAPATGA